ncbi:hypothetical protein TVAGG3_0289040 [Trichomonas vaginalis G3]|uniref:hypothetical protein n=1 Tax=Trichomonas vaginalis (strain ATCC PRA-98 / G3) TaxID=412133 RepID=UPI0021E5A18E|nr:hypothetical protein TVAGG3_0289040 [Trichomonas vaginalis G3]KAI5527115.1 hypothetical protein TVAGG3_0289040 [Trichomonas vaginalis G3]
MSDKAIIAGGKKLFQEFYNIPDGVNPETRRKYLNDAIDSYEGFDIAKESEALCKKFKVNIDYYYCSPQEKEDINVEDVDFELVESYIVDPKYKTINFLLTKNKDGQLHTDAITDVERLVGFRVCPYCKEEVYSLIDDPDRKNQARFWKHCEKCKMNGGKLIQDVQLQPTQQPYAPHITKQKIYQFLLAYGLQDYYKPTKHYITFDFETLETTEEKSITKSTTLNAVLKPFMVSSVCEDVTKNFCYATDENFIINRIDWLFEKAKEVKELNMNQYEEVFSKLKTIEQEEKFLKLLEDEYSNVNVIGFNSSKFDLNLILREFNTARWKILSMLGSSSRYKQITVHKKEYPNLRFIDIRNFVAGGTLDQFTQDFGDNVKRVK